MTQLWLIRTTFSRKEEALEVAQTLLEEKLIACANISDPITSVFYWEEHAQKEQEVVMLVKTTQQKSSLVMEKIKTLHSYQLPSILGWSVDSADPAFSHWVHEITGS